MKLHICVGGEDKPGYLNINPMAQNGKPSFKGNFKTLEGVVEVGEVTELLADTMTDFLPANDLFQTLKNWSGLLRHGGRIIVGGTDLYEVCRKTVIQELNIREANVLLYGNHVRKLGQMSLGDLVEILKSFGLKILTKRVDGVNMVVEAIRP